MSEFFDGDSSPFDGLRVSGFCIHFKLKNNKRPLNPSVANRSFHHLQRFRQGFHAFFDVFFLDEAHVRHAHDLAFKFFLAAGDGDVMFIHDVLDDLFAVEPFGHPKAG